MLMKIKYCPHCLAQKGKIMSLVYQQLKYSKDKGPSDLGFLKFTMEYSLHPENIISNAVSSQIILNSTKFLKILILIILKECY